MLTLIKYEFKGMYKSIIAILVSMFIMYILTNLKAGLFYGALNITVAFALGIAVTVILIINCIKCLSRYLYEKDGYLMFVTPKSGYEIVGSRLITSFILVAVVYIAFSLFMYFGLISKSLSMLPNIKLTISPYIILYMIINAVVSIILVLMTVYFSMVIGKSIYTNKKHEKLVAFISFIIVSILLGYAAGLFNNILVFNLPMNNMISNIGDISININGTNISNSTASLNIGRMLFNLAASVGLFIGTAYIVDNKLEI